MLLNRCQDRPVGAAAENPPGNAGATVQSLVGEVPHAAEQLSPRATTTEFRPHIYRSPCPEDWCFATRGAAC